MWAKPNGRSGLRVHGERGNRDVHHAVVRFARWLRTEYAFPVRVPIYLSPRSRIVTVDGEVVTASFFAPWQPDVEPYIKLATGDYPSELRAHGRSNALASLLCSVSHEIVHYQQWLETGKSWERGVARKAAALVRKYASVVSQP